MSNTVQNVLLKLKKLMDVIIWLVWIVNISFAGYALKNIQLIIMSTGIYVVVLVDNLYEIDVN